MKNIYNITALVLALIVYASCAKEESFNNRYVTDIVFKTRLQNATFETKAGEGLMINRVACAIFALNNGICSQVPLKVEYIDCKNGCADFSPALVKEQSYRIVMFACHCNELSGQMAYNLQNWRNITLAEPLANSELADAFVAAYDITAKGAATIEITLERPLAQLNVGVPLQDWILSQTNGKEPLYSEMTVTTPVVAFDAVALAATAGSGQQTVARQTITLGKNSISSIPNETFTANNTQYRYVSMGYLFALSKLQGSTNIDVNIKVYDSNGQIAERQITCVPINSNCKTNICGNLLN